MTNGMEGIIKQSQELFKIVYQRGYKAGQKDSLVVDSDKYIEQGRNEAWEAAKKIVLSSDDGGLSYEDLMEIFHTSSYSCILKISNVSDAIKGIETYEEQKKQEEAAKIERISNFCANRSCVGCVLRRDFKCGLGYAWRTDAASCGDIDTAYELVKEYENKHKEDTSDLAIGDEVTFLTVGGEIITGVITGEYSDTHEFRVMRATDGGECYCCKAKKTGRTFPEIAEVLKKMQEDK